MRGLPTSLILLCLAQLAFTKRGGGGGGGGFSSSSGSSGSDSGSGSSGSSGGGTYTPPPPPCDQGRCVCAMINERENIYELPGLYYNGTVTITHQVTQNSAWDAEAEGNPASTKCTNNDRAVKTYEYPALFYIGPNGNTSDTNPVFWALRGFQPPEQRLNDNYLDVYLRWLHIRSSDFVVSDTSLKAKFFGQYQYYATDETQTHRETHTYWDTNITSSGSLYSASATYTNKPAEISLSQTSFGSPPPGGKPLTSQYITLSDVCDYRQEMWQSKGSIPTSWIPEGNTNVWTTTPTLFLSMGATVSMADIGGETMTLTLNNTATNEIAFVNTQQATCSRTATTLIPAFVKSFNILHWADKSEYTKGYIWNISTTIGVSFTGSKVRENSTIITGNKDGVPQFQEQYERTNGSTEFGGSTSAKSDAGRVAKTATAMGWLLGFAVLFVGVLV